MKPRTVYARVSIEAGLDSLEEAKRATAAVLQALRDRLTPDEARQAAAQLPRELKTIWRTGESNDRRPVKMHRAAFYERVKTRGRLRSTRTALFATDAVFAALKEQLSEGEADDIVSQLPKDLKTVWRRA